MGIKDQREAANLTQVAVGEAVGVGRSAVSMWETGNSVPSARLLPALAELLHCSVDDLLRDDAAEQ